MTSFIMVGLGTVSSEREDPAKKSFNWFCFLKWYIEYNSTSQSSSTHTTSIADETLEIYKTNLTSLIETIKALKYDQNKNDDAPTVSASASKEANFELKIYWMLQDPIDEYKYKNFNNQTKLNNKQIDLYNRASISLL